MNDGYFYENELKRKSLFLLKAFIIAELFKETLLYNQ